MTARRSAWLIALAVVVALAAPLVAQAGEVTKWNQIATNTLVAFPGPGGGAPPALQINMGMTQGAVYAAVNAIERRHRPIILMKKFHSTASKEAAVATAAYGVLASLVSNAPGMAEATRTALLNTLATEQTASLLAIPAGPSKTEGIAAGNAAAAAMLADRADDGRFGPSPWQSNTAPGHWQPDPLAPPPLLDPTAWVANVRPFLVKSPSQFRTEGPQDLRSQAWANDFNEVKALGRATGSTRTDLQTQIALFWQSAGGPALLWNDVTRQLAGNLDIVDSAFLFGMQNLTAADAAISCWNDKYYWDFWRPGPAIREALRDDNAATEPDTSWTALLTAPYPEHPSGHLCLDGAHLTVLQMFFHTDQMEFNVTSSRAATLPLLPNPRHFTRFSAPLAEIVEARIWAGLHYRTGDVQGLNLGVELARYAQHHYFQPLH